MTKIKPTLETFAKRKRSQNVQFFEWVFGITNYRIFSSLAKLPPKAHQEDVAFILILNC
jgi:hypothetical protein